LPASIKTFYLRGVLNRGIDLSKTWHDRRDRQWPYRQMEHTVCMHCWSPLSRHCVTYTKNVEKNLQIITKTSKKVETIQNVVKTLQIVEKHMSQ